MTRTEAIQWLRATADVLEIDDDAPDDEAFAGFKPELKIHPHWSSVPRQIAGFWRKRLCAAIYKTPTNPSPGNERLCWWKSPDETITVFDEKEVANELR